MQVFFQVNKFNLQLYTHKQYDTYTHSQTNKQNNKQNKIQKEKINTYKKLVRRCKLTITFIIF